MFDEEISKRVEKIQHWYEKEIVHCVREMQKERVKDTTDRLNHLSQRLDEFANKLKELCDLYQVEIDPKGGGVDR